MDVVFVWTSLFVIFDALEAVAAANLTGPLNAAAIAGELRVVFTCSTRTISRLRWSTKPFGYRGDPQILTRENKVLPNYESQYFVESSNDSQLNLGIKSVDSSHAGRYICLELITSNTASAELTILDQKPVCNVTTGPLAVECDVPYKGTIVPEFELKLQTADSNKENGRLIRRLTLGTDVLRSLNFSCVASFSEKNTKNANLTPETENGVRGTVAGNAPSLVSAAKCQQLTSVASIAEVHHFELLVFAMTSIVHRLSS